MESGNKGSGNQATSSGNSTAGNKYFSSPGAANSSGTGTMKAPGEDHLISRAEFEKNNESFLFPESAQEAGNKCYGDVCESQFGSMYSSAFK
ncbi:hypothetical protein LINPERPRIM_LOCUS11904 [Linum perenne]